MTNKKNVTSLTLDPAQRAKADSLANMLGITRSALMNLLIANAEIREVAKLEPFVVLSPRKHKRNKALRQST